MLHPSTRKLIDKLIEMTAATKITWEEGDEGSCVYDTEGYRVLIGQSPSRVVLLDAGGRVLESVSDAMLCTAVDQNGRNYSVKIDLLVSAARRELMGAEAAISKIVSALDLSVQEEPAVESAQRSEEPEEQVLTAGDQGEDEPVLESRVARFVAEKTSVSRTVPPEKGAIPEITPDIISEDTIADEPQVAQASGSPWDVPETAVMGVPDDTEDFVDLDGAPAAFSPSGKKAGMASLAETAALKPEPEAPEPEDYAMAAAVTASAEEFSSVCMVPADESSAPETEQAEQLKPAMPVAQAIIHIAPYWDGRGRSIDAVAVTPEIYMQPLQRGDETPDATVVIETETDLATIDNIFVDSDDVDFEIGDFDVIEVFPELLEADASGGDNVTLVEIGGIGTSASDEMSDLPYEFATPESEMQGTVSDDVVTSAEAAPEAEDVTRVDEKKKEPSTEEVLADIRKTVHKYNPWM